MTFTFTMHNLKYCMYVCVSDQFIISLCLSICVLLYLAKTDQAGGPETPFNLA